MKNNNDKEIVFDQHWFIKHQSKLLWLANSWIGKYIFKFKKMGHYLNPKKKIVKITPYSVAQFNKKVGKKYEYTEHFFSRNEYARKLYFVLLPMWYAMHIWDWFVADHFQLAPQLSFGFSTLTQYPGTIGAGNPCNGTVYQTGAQTDWTTLQASAGSATDTDTFFQISSGSSTDNWITIMRGIFCFDTSSLGAGANISAAVLSLWANVKKDDNNITPNIDIYASTPANTNALVAGDFTQIGTVSQTGSPMSYATWTLSQYNDFTFNATGIGNVSKTGISKFGARNANYDVANSAPTWSLANKNSRFAGFDFLPKLVVTYSTVVGPANLKSYNTNLSANIKSINTNLIANVKSLDTNV